MDDVPCEFGIVVYSSRNTGGETKVNLQATSQSVLRHQVILDLKDVEWADVIEKIRGLNLDKRDKIDSIEAYLKESPCQLTAHCKMSDLTAIGFKR